MNRLQVWKLTGWTSRPREGKMQNLSGGFRRNLSMVWDIPHFNERRNRKKEHKIWPVGLGNARISTGRAEHYGRGQPTASCRWTGWVWKTTSWSARPQGKLSGSFKRSIWIYLKWIKKEITKWNRLELDFDRSCPKTMNGEEQPLVADEPVEFENNWLKFKTSRK